MEVMELPGCHTQAKTPDELMRRTKEAIELYLDTEGYLDTGKISFRERSHCSSIDL